MTSRNMCSVATLCLLICHSDAQAGQTGRYPTTYNLIDADPSCMKPVPSDVCCGVGGADTQCPDLYSGAGDVDVMAIHPNIQERTDFTMRNMARLFPDFYASSPWGWGGGAYAGDCDQPSTPPTKPFYFMSEAVQAARWNSFSGATEYSGCTRGDCALAINGDSCSDAQTSHYTCWSYCDINVYDQCGYNYRTKGMVQPLFSANAWNDVGSEGIWGGNTALLTSSAHCGMVFNEAYHHQGIGYYPSGSTTMVGIKDTEDWEDHVFAHATHFGWDRTDFTFLTQFFGGKQSEAVTLSSDVFLLFKGEMLAMDQIVASDDSSGTSAFFVSYQPMSDECEPYAFVAKDVDGSWWRLPEDERFYFSTVDHPDALIDESATCAENHYFNADGAGNWVANGADDLDNVINANNGCVGCSKIDALEAAFDTDVTSRPTVQPTRTPTTRPTVDTDEPTSSPTTAAPTVFDCGDDQCITIVGGVGGLDGDWTASGECFSSKSVYTQNDRDDAMKLCLSGSTWTFTETVCDADDSRVAYCTKVRADIGYCSGSDAWNVRGDDGSFSADATMTMTKTNERCPTPAPTNAPTNVVTPAPANAVTPAPVTSPVPTPTTMVTPAPVIADVLAPYLTGAPTADVLVSTIEEDDCPCDDALDTSYCCDEMEYASECEAGCAGYNVTASCVREECIEDPVGSSGALRLTFSAVMAMVMGVALFV